MVSRLKPLSRLRDIFALRQRTALRDAIKASQECRLRNEKAALAEARAELTRLSGQKRIIASRNATFTKPITAATIQSLRTTETHVETQVEAAQADATHAKTYAEKAEKERKLLARKLQRLNAKSDATAERLKAQMMKDKQRADDRAAEDFVDQKSANTWRAK